MLSMFIRASACRLNPHFSFECWQVATQEAHSIGATAVAKCGLLKQFELVTLGQAPEDFSKPGQEALLLRALIDLEMADSASQPALQHQQPSQTLIGHSSAAADAAAPVTPAPAGSGHTCAKASNHVELSGYFNQASGRLADIGADKFFGDKDGRYVCQFSVKGSPMRLE